MKEETSDSVQNEEQDGHAPVTEIVSEPPVGARRKNSVHSWLRDMVVSVAVSTFIIIFLYKPVRVEGDVPPFTAGKLAQFHEQHAAMFGKRRVAKSFGIEQKRAGGPIAVFVGEHAIEHEDLFAIGMIVGVEFRMRLIAHD